MNKTQFLEKLNKSTKPMIVDFWAPWCGPCKVSKPILEKLAEEYNGQVEFLQVNADQSQELLKELKVYGIPTLIAYKSSQEVTRMVGAKPATVFRDLFESMATGKPVSKGNLALGQLAVRLLTGGLFVYLGMQNPAQNWVFLAIGGVLLASILFSMALNR